MQFLDEEDEVTITKKPKLEESVVANGDAFFSVKGVPGDGHCIVNCFSTFFGKVTSEDLNEIWQEFHNNIEEYMKFGEYETPLNNCFNSCNSRFLTKITIMTPRI